MSSRKLLANAIRALSMDAVQRANSGHPGAPMGMADIAEVLYSDFMRHNPANPDWSNRDRFVMSNGHGSMLAYSVLHLSGYDVTIEDLKNFRQLHSKTPGHPEHGYAPGIETTTGPLGQGISNAVGMAIAERVLAATFNRDDFNIVNHFTYVFLGDGCMMEGISHEACSLAGTLGLGKLIAFWDDNGISIDGKVEGWFLDDTPKRFEAYGWHVVEVDGHDPDEIKIAIEAARAITAKPSLICCKTIIGFGAPNKAGGHAVHGAPLGEDEVALARVELSWEHPPFEVPEEVYQGWDHRNAGQAHEDAWQQKFDAYREEYPELAAEFERRVKRELPPNWDEATASFIAELDEAAEDKATRQASLATLESYSVLLPELFGGSADLGGSNGTEWSGYRPMRAELPDANYINYGVREFGMSAMVNGIALHGGLIPFGATFLVFSDYARNAVRMAALMKIPSIFVYTHDSIGLGEDGPTHQAVEHIPSLRMIPNMHLWRPCDTVETAVSWKAAIERSNGPSCLVFSRQGLKHQARSPEQIEAIVRGGYILRDCEGTPDAIIIATGSEVELAVAAYESDALVDENIRVVSMPCTAVFDRQPQDYRDSVLPPDVSARVVVEAAVTTGWYRYIGMDGVVIGIDTFGESAPAKELFAYFGFTVDKVVEAVSNLLGTD
ncbi:MAG: transketolase [Gammaproteobacteria bacterium]|nr:transketolase [Gammaproteobacteria bacterium]MDH3856409.1 transketolase [Gammaproteobacteria bacterium]